LKTFIKVMVHSGAETLTDQLSGTPVSTVGNLGRVQAVLCCSDELTVATLKGRQSGIEVIPDGSGPNLAGAADGQEFGNGHFVFDASGLTPGEDLDFDITTLAASSSKLGVRTS